MKTPKCSIGVWSKATIDARKHPQYYEMSVLEGRALIQKAVANARRHFGEQ